MQKHGDVLFAPETEPDAADFAQVGLYLASKALSDRVRGGASPWTDARLAGWRNGAKGGGAMMMELEQPVTAGAEGAEVAVAAATVVKVKPIAPTFGSHRLAFNAEVTASNASRTAYSSLHPAHLPDGVLSTVLDATRQQLRITPEPGSRAVADKFHLFSPHKGLDASVREKLPAWLAAGTETRKAGSARAPMPSRVVQVMVEAGQSVKQGDPLVMVEAMKTVSCAQLRMTMVENADFCPSLGLAGARPAGAEGWGGERGQGGGGRAGQGRGSAGRVRGAWRRSKVVEPYRSMAMDVY